MREFASRPLSARLAVTNGVALREVDATERTVAIDAPVGLTNTIESFLSVRRGRRELQ